MDDAGMDAVVNICARLKSNMATSMLLLFDVFNTIFVATISKPAHQDTKTHCSPRRMEQLGEELKGF